tara:strand:- start:1184 stop:1387 length:204 start_codon:yes stop_codon:yes gene_type:complete
MRIVRVSNYHGDRVWTSQGYLDLPDTYTEPDWELEEDEDEDEDGFTMNIIYQNQLIRVQSIDFEWEK